MSMDEMNRFPSRRATRILWGWTTAVVVATVVGTAAAGSSDPAELPSVAVIPISPEGLETSTGAALPSPPAGTGSPTTPSTGPEDGTVSPAPEPRPAPTTTDPAPPAQVPRTNPAPPDNAPPRTTPPRTRPPRTTPPRTAPPASSKPHIIGPTGPEGFDDFLDQHCKEEDRRSLGATLLNGRRTPETGRWACLRFGVPKTIDVDEACQEAFGANARAREKVSGDIRTLRCFDS